MICPECHGKGIIKTPVYIEHHTMYGKMSEQVLARIDEEKCERCDGSGADMYPIGIGRININSSYEGGLDENPFPDGVPRKIAFTGTLENLRWAWQDATGKKKHFSRREMRRFFYDRS